MPQT